MKEIPFEVFKTEMGLYLSHSKRYEPTIACDPEEGITAEIKEYPVPGQVGPSDVWMEDHPDDPRWQELYDKYLAELYGEAEEEAEEDDEDEEITFDGHTYINSGGCWYQVY